MNRLSNKLGSNKSMLSTPTTSDNCTLVDVATPHTNANKNNNTNSSSSCSSPQQNLHHPMSKHKSATEPYNHSSTSEMVDDFDSSASSTTTNSAANAIMASAFAVDELNSLRRTWFFMQQLDVQEQAYSQNFGLGNVTYSHTVCTPGGGNPFLRHLGDATPIRAYVPPFSVSTPVPLKAGTNLLTTQNFLNEPYGVIQNSSRIIYLGNPKNVSADEYQGLGMNQQDQEGIILRDDELFQFTPLKNRTFVQAAAGTKFQSLFLDSEGNLYFTYFVSPKPPKLVVNFNFKTKKLESPAAAAATKSSREEKQYHSDNAKNFRYFQVDLSPLQQASPLFSTQSRPNKSNKIVKMSFRDSHAIFVTEQGEAWGLRFKPSTREAPELRPQDFIPAKITNESVLLAECGGCVSVLVTSTKIKIFHNLKERENYFACCADIEQQIFMPKGDQIKKVSCGSSHVVVLTERGKVFGYGHNFVGQLGLTEQVEYSNRFEELVLDTYITEYLKEKTHNLGLGFLAANSNPRVVDISCGYQHTVLLLDDGGVLVTGDNSFRQGGTQQVLNPSTNQSSLVFCQYQPRSLMDNILFAPQNNNLLRQLPIAKVSCGWFYTILVTRDGKIMGCGENDAGQMGVLSELQRQHQKLPYGPFREILPISLQLSSYMAYDDKELHGDLKEVATNDHKRWMVNEVICGHKHTIVILKQLSQVLLFKAKLLSSQQVMNFTDIKIVCRGNTYSGYGGFSPVGLYKSQNPFIL